MQDVDSSMYPEPPDLLRRFIPTTVKGSYHAGGVRVMVQTNDVTLLPALPLAVDVEEAQAGEARLEWTLIRDADSHGLLGPLMRLNSETLTVIMMGTACLMGLDRERRELISFIAAEVDPRTHQELVVPLLRQVTNEIFFSDPSSAMVASSQGLVDV